MPGHMDGPALFRWVQIERPSLASRMLFMTGDTLAPDTSEFLKSTNVPCLLKPFHRVAYLQAVAEILADSLSDVSLA